MIDQDTVDKFNSAVHKGIKKIAIQAHQRSVNTAACYAPRKTGALIESAYQFDNIDGYNIGYGSNIIYWAGIQEFGAPSAPFEQQDVFVPEHTRVTKGGKIVAVKAYTQKARSTRMICFEPKISKLNYGQTICRPLSSSPEIEGRHYLGRAVYDELDENLLSVLEQVLRNALS